MNMEYDHLIKSIIIGDSGIGKSGILLRFTENTWSDKYISSIGVEFKFKTIVINDKVIKLQIWDSAGQERFHSITTNYYRGSHIIYLCYDITDKKSFDNLDMWLNEIKKFASSKAKIIICGTKIDLDFMRQIPYKEAKNFCDERGFDYYETSSKLNKNIDIMFNETCEKMLQEMSSVANKNKPIKSLDKTTKIIPINSSTLKINTITDIIHKKCC